MERLCRKLVFHSHLYFRKIHLAEYCQHPASRFLDYAANDFEVCSISTIVERIESARSISCAIGVSDRMLVRRKLMNESPLLIMLE